MGQIMRCSVLAATLLTLLPARGYTQDRPPLHINSVRVGFPVNPAISHYKSGFWTPVYIDVTAGPNGLDRGEFVVESIDSEGVRNRYAVPLSPLRKDEQSYIIGYTKPGSTQGEFTVTAQVNGRAIATNQDNFPALELEQQLFVTI